MYVQFAIIQSVIYFITVITVLTQELGVGFRLWIEISRSIVPSKLNIGNKMKFIVTQDTDSNYLGRMKILRKYHTCKLYVSLKLVLHCITYVPPMYVVLGSHCYLLQQILNSITFII